MPVSIPKRTDKAAGAPPGNEALLRESIECFFFAYRAFTTRPDRILATRGLGRVHHRILYFVGRQPGLSINTLLQVLRVSKQALNAPLRHLIEMKLVAVQASSFDRRVRELSLTAEGRRLETRLTGTQMQHLQAAFERSGPQARDAWLVVMQKIAFDEPA